jgi:hypothetical protein
MALYFCNMQNVYLLFVICNHLIDNMLNYRWYKTHKKTNNILFFKSTESWTFFYDLDGWFVTLDMNNFWNKWLEKKVKLFCWVSCCSISFTFAWVTVPMNRISIRSPSTSSKEHPFKQLLLMTSFSAVGIAFLYQNVYRWTSLMHQTKMVCMNVCCWEIWQVNPLDS